MMMAAPTILTHGTPEQIERHVRAGVPARGVVSVVQRTGLRFRPRRAHDPRDPRRRSLGDLGQKVWSSQAMEADYGMLMARTDFDAPKHAGISWFALHSTSPV